MEPRQQGPVGGMERAPAMTGAYEARPPHEVTPEQSPEHYNERTLDKNAVQAEVAQVAMPALPTPVVSAPQPILQDDSALPDAAADDDLIEKEWVDKAKKIIAETKDDPYRREQEINKLQIEYIRRRYGREIGNAGE